MLSVLKRRWKPSKRASSSKGGDNSSISSDLTLDPPRSRQIHPTFGDKASYPSYRNNTSNVENYSPVPNIVVEGGRIEFIRPSQDNGSLPRKNTISQSSQTLEELMEKVDPLKESLETRIQELEQILHSERIANQRDRTTFIKLQRQANKREAIKRDVLERERQLRMDTEARLREATVETERAYSKIYQLQKELARFEESAKNASQYKQQLEQLKQEKGALILSYEARLLQHQNQISKLQLENESLRGQSRSIESTCVGEALVTRLATLESDHAALVRDADEQRRQYERCLDDVANQVVRALLSQKGLREEIVALKRRIRELEGQNRTLSNLLTLNTNHKVPNEMVKNMFEARPAALIAALSLDTSWFPINRPKSLNLQIPVVTTTKIRRTKPVDQKRPEEEEGNESPESGNRDEGYSTMSSDVQGDCVRQEAPRGLEDLKEANDETEADISQKARLVALDAGNPDVLYLPLNVTFGLNPRHSYPPTKDLLPYQHVMRSFSDSHLCLKLSPYVTSPIGSTSLLLLEEDGWDTEYVQQWLRLDDTRNIQQRRDLLELEYDQTELEDWSFSLSSEDLANTVNGVSTTSTSTVVKESIGVSTLPAIREHNNVELEEDTNECLWNSATYLTDRSGSELMTLLMDNRASGRWPYATSPGASWSSEDGLLDNVSSKRSSIALSGCSDDQDSPSVGTNFTRDFYRLVKFESTKSLASNSSKGGKNDRDQTLQNVLSFIAEQQMYLPEASSSIINNADFSHSTEVLETGKKWYESTTGFKNSEETVDKIKNIQSKESVQDSLDNISASPLTLEEGIISTCSYNGGISYSTIVPIELNAVPEEDEEAATSSSPSSTVISPAEPPIFTKGTDRILNFHDRATSKDVINELNRMIRNGEDSTSKQDSYVALEKLDLACCCPTGWVHVERDIDFTDPKARANLLDVMLASSESSSATSSSGSAGSDSGDEPLDYRHFHRLHRYRRQKKASAVQAQRVLRLPSNWGSARPSIIGRGGDFFVRYGDKEREAVASFDFLDDIAVSSVQNVSSPVSSNSSGRTNTSSSLLDLVHSTSDANLMKLSPL